MPQFFESFIRHINSDGNSYSNDVLKGLPSQRQYLLTSGIPLGTLLMTFQPGPPVTRVTVSATVDIMYIPWHDPSIAVPVQSRVLVGVGDTLALRFGSLVNNYLYFYLQGALTSNDSIFISLGDG
jgi:hypothetical protein